MVWTACCCMRVRARRFASLEVFGKSCCLFAALNSKPFMSVPRMVMPKSSGNHLKRAQTREETPLGAMLRAILACN